MSQREHEVCFNHDNDWIIVNNLTFSQFSLTLLEKHKNSLTELIQRDKNRPSVIMWSIANEPETNSDLAGLYFA